LPDGAPVNDNFQQLGADIEFQIPIFDSGEAKVREAEETYARALNRLAEKAVNVRSEVREAYAAYRGTYDIAQHYRKEILPLRQIISDESLLRYNGMLDDVSQLIIDARQKTTSGSAAIEAQRDFWLADADLQAALVGGGASGESNSKPAVAAQTATQAD
jgi:outer membrane protein TolC